MNASKAIGIIKTDSLGNVKWQKITNAYNNYTFNSFSVKHFFKQLKSGDILVTGDFEINPYQGRPFLCKVNQYTGDTMWLKSYSQPGDSAYLFCSAELLDSSIVALGLQYYDVGNNKFKRPFILKTDKNGEYKWHKYLTGFTATYMPWYNKMLNLNDNEFIVVGVRSYQTPGYRGFLMKFDTLGNLLLNNTYAFNTYTATSFKDIIVQEDGNFLLCGGITTYNDWNFSIVKDRPFLCKISSSNANVLAWRMYGAEKPDGHSFSSVYEDALTRVIYTSGGEYFQAMTQTWKSTFYKMKSNLDSIYSRYYESDVGGPWAATNLVRTNEGGFISAMTGSAFNGQQQYWVIKTDTLGCDSMLGCSYVGLDERNLSGESSRIWPNPADDVINVHSHYAEADEIKRIEIYDDIGQLIQKIDIYGQGKKITVDVSQLSTGIFHLIIVGRQQLHTRLMIVR